MSDISGIGSGGQSWFINRLQQFQQNLFNKIDANGDGTITQSELENAVTTAGGTAAAADALYATLDPNNTGGVSEQQFAQNLPQPSFSDPMQAQLIAAQAQQSDGSSGPGGGLAQSLFAQIDANGDGNITQTELENAVTTAGGTTTAADALYAKLDPNNTGSVSEQQFAQNLHAVMGHHHHHHFQANANQDGDNDSGDTSNDASPQSALAALLGGTSNGSDPAQLTQDLFSQIDSNGDGSITQAELENAVTAGGGTIAAADALYAQLDPTNSGSVSEASFAQALQPPSASGNTAQDAIAALFSTLDPATTPQTASAAPGNTAQDALWDLVQSAADSTASNSQSSGNSAQDALAALLQANPGTWPSGWGGVAPQDANGDTLNSMVSLFDTLGNSGETSRQLLASLFDAINRGS